MVDAKAAFALVRDMPYQRASTREPEAIIQEWRGICSGKHYLLDQIFREEGLESRVIMCTHRFTEEATPDFPPEERDPQEFKEELIEIFCGSQTDHRDRFINGLSE